MGDYENAIKSQLRAVELEPFSGNSLVESSSFNGHWTVPRKSNWRASPERKRWYLKLEWLAAVECVGSVPHLVILTLSMFALLVAVLDINDQRQVVVPGVNVPLPGLCAYQQLVGHDCPGCGLTRCFVCLADGEIASAWSYNAVGTVFFVIVVFQIPFRTLQIRRLTHGQAAIRLCRELWVIWPLLIVLLTQWLIRSITQLVV